MFRINFCNDTFAVQECTISTKLVTYGGVGP
jgi:hypothetical protein